MPEVKFSRREALKRAATAAAAFAIVPRHVLGGTGYTPPSEQLTYGIIGTGGMGMQHLRMQGARLLAVCDVDRRHLNEALRVCAAENIGAGSSVQGHHEFRELLGRPDIDIVHIVTPPHWHALMAIAAAEAGKDIWCEKPMTRTVAEGVKLVEAVRRYDRIFRINTWWRLQEPFFDLGPTVKTLRKVVQSGLFGWPLKITIGQSTGFDWKWALEMGKPNLGEQPVPPELDYDMWLGPAPYKPYHEDRVHFKFRGYWDYDGGGLTDMGQHYMDPVQYMLGKDEESPIEVETEGPDQHPDAVGRWEWVRYRYADGCEIVCDGRDERRDDVPFLEGPGGKLYRHMRSTIPDLEKKIAQMPDPPPQESDFYHCVRTRTPFALNETVAHRSCTLVNIGKIALRLRRPLRFDAIKQRFINDETANRMLEEPMRAPWRIA